MSNVLINCVSAGSGGALTYLINLVPKLIERLDRENINVFLLIKEDQFDLIDKRIEKHVIMAPNLGGYKRFLWEYFSLSSIIKSNDIDLIFTPYQIARIFSGIKNIVMFRNMEPFTFHKYKNTYKNSIRNYILKLKTINTIKNTDKVIAVSGYVRDVILENKMAGIDSIINIYHGRNKSFNAVEDMADLEILKALDIKGEYVFTCGSLFPYRKCEDIIKAFEDVKSSGAVLVVAGSSNDGNYINMLNDLILQYKMSDSVHMLGHVSLQEMIVLYRNCKLFVTSTETEACPNIAIEAMSSGCNILSSDIMPLPEMFKDAAIYYKHGDLVELAEKMRNMFTSSYGVNSEALSIIESFTWDKCADQTSDLILKELRFQ